MTDRTRAAAVPAQRSAPASQWGWAAPPPVHPEPVGPDAATARLPRVVEPADAATARLPRVVEPADAAARAPHLADPAVAAWQAAVDRAASQATGRHAVAEPAAPAGRPPVPAESRPSAAAHGTPVVRAAGLGLRTRRGWVFRGVDLDVYPGELVALTGPSGSGRSSLLLALAGRFTTSDGTLTRNGRAALGYVPGVSETEPGLTVAEHVEERLLLLGRARWRRRYRRMLVDEALADYPGGADQLVRTIDTYQQHLLGLVLARLEGPRLIVVDDADADLSTAERADLWRRLRRLADEGIAVVASCREIDPQLPDRTVTLEGNR
jgi:ABC-2 type transport system ATP-binding protein